MKAKNKNSGEKAKTKNGKVVGALYQNTEDCGDRNCPAHGFLKARGKVFQGKVIKKFKKRIVIEFERNVYISKYERYAQSRTKIHARLPTCIEEKIQIGDVVKVQECRPLSKIIHFVVVEKINQEENKK